MSFDVIETWIAVGINKTEAKFDDEQNSQVSH